MWGLQVRQELVQIRVESCGARARLGVRVRARTRVGLRLEVRNIFSCLYRLRV